MMRHAADDSESAWEAPQGHAEHFLMRLDRVARDELDTVLRLYYDSDLLRHVLTRSDLPEAASRVAISLGHPRRGPFVIVTRTGCFVTCLARDMNPKHPVITRAELDVRVAELLAFRERVSRASAAAAPFGGARALLERLFDADKTLSREEFSALTVIAPLYAVELARLSGTLLAALSTTRPLLESLPRSGGPEVRGVLRAYARAKWVRGHTAICCAAALAAAECFSGVYAPEGTSPLVESEGATPIAARILWAPPSSADQRRALLERALFEPEPPLRLADLMLGLAAASVSSGAAARGEARRLLGDALERLRGEPVHRDALAFVERLHRELDRVLTAPESAWCAYRAGGIAVAMTLSRNLAHDDPSRFERPEDVPEDVAFALAANQLPNVLLDVAGVRALASALPWLARASAEALYVRRAFVPLLPRSRKPDVVLDAVRRRAHYESVPEPAPGRGELGRKHPCPCGSGRRYKRCCAEARGCAA